MQKNNSRNAQKKGAKRAAKNQARKQKETENKMYIVKLMHKYGAKLQLKERPRAGEKYLSWYLNDRGNKENNNG